MLNGCNFSFRRKATKVKRGFVTEPLQNRGGVRIPGSQMPLLTTLLLQVLTSELCFPTAPQAIAWLAFRAVPFYPRPLLVKS